MKQKILMLGTFDTKGREFSLLYDEVLKHGIEVMTMNTGVMGTTQIFPVDIEADKVAAAAGSSIAALREKADRGYAMRIMCTGAQKVVDQLYAQGKICAVIGMGGGGGTSIATTAMRNLPVGFPKVCITTLASGDTSEYVGTKDIVLFPSVVDICGVNQFSRKIITRAAGAVCGMAASRITENNADRQIIFISMFGNSTQCVEQCARLLDEQGYDTMIFHATGTGGRAMEELTEEGYPVAVLDITTTEWADEVGGGVLSAGTARLDAPGKMGIPHLIVPGCVDMVNFRGMASVPSVLKESGRQLYEWNPMVTLMRTNLEENIKMGKIFAEKANAAKGPVKFLFPLRGVSILDGEGQPFCDWEVDKALYQTVKDNLKKGIEAVEIDANINDLEFSQKSVEILLQMLNQK